MTTPQAAPESAIDDLLALDEIQARLLEAFDWFEQTVLNLDNGVQLALITAALAPALIFGPKLRQLVIQTTSGFLKAGLARRLINAVSRLMTPLALLLVLTLIQLVLAALERPYALLNAATSLMTAWIVIRAVSLIIQSKFWSNVAFYIAWPIAVLDVFGLLVPVTQQMQAFAIPLGVADDGTAIQLSLFDIVRTLVYFGVLFWLASLAGRTINSQLEKTEELSPAFKALISKVLGVLLPVTALLIALQMTGFNLATLAIFSGAVGIGVGLGLQKTVANFAAGFTLLADKSIKPGDAIEVDGTFGWVSAMQSRYVSVRTRDGTEMLIPNEHFIVNGVINWSHSDRVVRLHAPFGVSYKTRDLRAVQDLAQKAAASVPRVVTDKDPVCNVMEFGNSAVNFDLRFWIADPEAGLSNVRSDVYLAVWDALHEAGIEIPFPQMDLHVKALPAAASGPPDQA